MNSMINFEKGNGLVPVIIQDETTLQVLMLGFMNEEALKLTEETGKVHFFSRTKERIWLKGESSENYLYVKSIEKDCDDDTLLIKVKPTMWSVIPVISVVLEKKKPKVFCMN